jgi:hypothetical protein
MQNMCWMKKILTGIVHAVDTNTRRKGRYQGIVPATKYIYRIYPSTKVYVPSLELGLPRPLSRKRVFPSRLNQRGGGDTLPCGLWGGGGKSRFRRLDKKLSTRFYSVPVLGI